MLNSYEFNYTLLNKKYKKERDNLLLNRLKNIKSIVNTNCPHSFSNFKKKTTKSNLKKDLSKK
jgi:hypothetical protein